MQTNQPAENKLQTVNNQFPCSKCGALLKYKPGSQYQVCEYCNYKNIITQKHEVIKEYDLPQALQKLEKVKPASVAERAHCNSCGASFKFAESVFAGECPFCGSDVVTNLEQTKPIHPESLLPFLIDETIAKKKFRKWLDSLWFAPSKLKKYTRGNTKLIGIYLPYWTYDSYTESNYTGARGDTYFVQERVTYVQNGRRVSTIRRVPKIRWTNVRGRVSRFFDDVLIGASLSLPRQILDRLHSWDLEHLVPYDEKYISGFQSEYYQVDLDEGFDRAKRIMNGIIYRDIAFDIGGDHQRIYDVRTHHHNMTYKHCLLPIWSAAFSYRNKTYRFVINGRTGKVQGERPYSYWKIALAIITGLIVVFGGLGYLEHIGAFEQIQYSGY